MKRNRLSAARVCRLAAVSLLLSAALPSAARAARWKTPTEAEKKIVEDPAKGLVGAVYLEKMEESVLSTYHVWVRAKILSKNGFDIGTVDDLQSDAYEIEGRTVSPDGKIVELSKKDIRTLTTVKTGGVSYERKAFTMPALEPGCFIEYGYREYGAFGSESAYHSEVLFQDKYPILLQELRTPKRFPFSSSIRNQNGMRIDFREESGGYVYAASNAPALREEPYGSPVYERSAEVIFAYVFPGLSGDTADEFWKNATKHVLTPLMKQEMVRPGKVEDRLKTLGGSREQDPAARLRAIYNNVQKTVKNRSILRAGETVPKGGWKKNEDAGETLSHGEGSPYDLAMVCASMLRADGWKFRVIMAPDRETRFFRRDIPSVFQFGAWLIEVPDPKDPAKVTYLSFEHPLMPFGFVPWKHLGVDSYAVNLDDAVGAVVQIAQAPGASNARRREWKVSLAEEGDALVERKSVWLGQQAFQLRADLYRRGKESLDKETREDYQKLDPPGQVESIGWENDESPESDLKGTIRLTRKGMASALPGGRLEFSPLTMIRGSNPFTRADRTGPIYFPYPYVDEDTMVVSPPPGYVLDALPQPVNIPTSAGRYSVQVQKGDGDSVRIVRSLELKRFSGGDDLYASYRSLFEGATKGDTGFSILFKKSPARKTS